MNKYLKQALLWGISGGLVCFFWFLVVYFAGANPFYSFSQKLVILLQAAIAYLAIKNFKDASGSEEFSFGEGILCGLSITIVLAIISGLFTYIFVQYFQPEMVTSHILELKNYLVSNKQTLIKQSSLEVFEGNLKNVDGVTAYTLGLDELIWKIIRGTMFTILVSLVLRKKKEQ